MFRRFQQDKPRLHANWSAVLERAGLLAQLQKAGRTLQQDADGLFKLDLGGFQLSDVSFLKGMPLHELNLGGTGVSDLTALVDMPLAVLRLDQTKVTDLTPLQGMRLRVLGLRGTAVRDLMPLRGMPLEELLLDGCPHLADPRAIAGFDSLERLTMPSQWKDIEFLRHSRALEALAYEYDPKWGRAAEDFWRQFDADRK